MAVAAHKCTTPSAAGTAPAQVAVARSRAPPAAGTAPASVVVARRRAPAAAGTARATVVVAPPRRSSRRRRNCCHLLRGSIRVGTMGKLTIAVGGGDDICLTVPVGQRLLIAWRAGARMPRARWRRSRGRRGRDEVSWIYARAKLMRVPQLVTGLASLARVNCIYRWLVTKRTGKVQGYPG